MSTPYMRRLSVALAMTLTMGAASADNSNPSHNNGYGGSGQYLALIGVGTIISIARGYTPLVEQRGVVYSTYTPLVAQYGVRCELASYMDNGVVRTVNICR